MKKISTAEIAEIFFLCSVLFCTPILLHRARKRCYLQKTTILSFFIDWDLLLKWQMWRWPYLVINLVTFSKNNYAAQCLSVFTTSVVCWRQCEGRELECRYVVFTICHNSIQLDNFYGLNLPCGPDHGHMREFREWTRPCAHHTGTNIAESMGISTNMALVMRKEWATLGST